MHDTSVRFKIKNWKYVPKRQKKAVLMLCACAVSFCVFVGTAVQVMIYDIQKQPQQESQDAVEMMQILPAQPIGLLSKGTDAGEEYLADTVFVGDSNTVRLYLYGLVPLENYMAQQGIGVESVKDYPCVYFKDDNQKYTIPQAIAKVKPRRIVMTFGTNDVDGTFTKEEFIEEYRSAVHSIQKADPYCDIIINSIPPIAKYNDYKKISQKRIDEFNNALKDMAEEEMLPFLDSAQALKDKDGFLKSEHVIADGLHLNEKALAEMLLQVRTHAVQTQDRHPYTQEPLERRVPPEFGK